MSPNDEPLSRGQEAAMLQPPIQNPPVQDQNPPAQAPPPEQDSAPLSQPPAVEDSLAPGASAQEAALAGEATPAAEFSFTWDGIKEWAAALLADAGMLLLKTVGVLVLAWLSFKLAMWILHRIEKKFVKRTHTQIDDYILDFVHRAAKLTIVVAALLEVCRMWSLERPEQWIEAAWLVLIFLPGSRLVCAILRLAEGRVLAQNPNLGTVLPMINRGVRIALIVLGALFALAHAGVDIAPILGAAGVMGLALSLAAKDTLSNLIAGVLLLIDRPFQVGDRIELWSAPLETGTWGDVVDIGLRATKIRNPDNLVVVVPNNEIMQRDIINYTMSGDDIRLRLPFSVAYESDVHRAKAVLVKVALEVKGVKVDPAPFVIVRGFGPSEVNLQLRVWISDARVRRRVGDEITERVLVAFEAEGLEIPYPKRELYVHDAAGLLPPPKKE